MAELYDDNEPIDISGDLASGPATSIFDPRVVNQATLLTLLQIKDYLAVIAANLDEDATTEVEHLHDLGQFLCPVAVPAASGE